MIFPHTLFKRAKLKTTDVAALCGVSRITGYRWMSGASRNGTTKGAGVNVLLEHRVQPVIEAVRAAVREGDLPNATLAGLPPAERFPKIQAIVNRHLV